MRSSRGVVQIRYKEHQNYRNARAISLCPDFKYAFQAQT
jgi:hypothetical protein